MTTESQIIIVGSTSEHKLNAVHQAFQQTTDLPFEIKGFKARSRINEQPVGIEETVQGALNRLDHAKELAKTHPWHIAVGIENGIIPFQVMGVQRWMDYAWVVVENNKGDLAIANSSGVEFPSNYVEMARSLGFDTITVGSIIAQETGCDGTDPHLYLTNRRVSRSEMLIQAVMNALGQLHVSNRTIKV